MRMIHSNVVNLSFYRRRQHALPKYFSGTAQPRESRLLAKNAESERYYFERMKVNVAIFVFLVLFVMSGVWLIDGITQAFVH
jgi:hypothetical protein